MMKRLMKQSLAILLAICLCAALLVQGTAASNSLTKQIKTDYKEILQYYYGGEYAWITYAVYDIDKDGIPELFVRNGTCEADYMYIIYTHNGTRAVYLGQVNGGHSALYAVPNQNGVYVHTAHMGSECITTVKIVNQGLYVKNGEWRDVGDGDYTSLDGYISEIETDNPTLINRIKTRAIAAPTDLKASSNKTTSLKLTWQKVKDAKGYVVYLYDAAKQSYQKLGTTAKAAYTVKGLTSGSKYKFAVKAYLRDGGKIKYSVLSLPLTTATRPQAPVVRETTIAGEPGLQWDKVPGATGYIVYYGGETGESYEKILKTSMTSFVFWEIPEHNAYYKVYAYSSVGGKTIKSVASNVVVVTA